MPAKRAKLDEMSAVDTSEDWLGVGLPSLVAFERRLRCDICSELFDRPVQVNGCAHTFCETCIRGALDRSSKAACPVLGCANTNIGTSKSKLVPVPALADAASTWRLARDDLMSKLRTSERRSKRKSSEPTPALAEARPSKRSRKSEPVEEIIDSDDEIEIVEPTDFVKCPACQRSMKLEKLDRHLNSCGKTSTTTGWGALGGSSKAPPKRIATAELRTSEIVDKLTAYGFGKDIKDESDKFVRAFWTAWRHIHNANVESAEGHRVADSVLRQQMRDKIRGIRAETGPADAQAAAIKPDHQKKHASEFKRLIEAERKRAAASSSRASSIDPGPAPAAAPVSDPVIPPSDGAPSSDTLDLASDDDAAVDADVAIEAYEAVDLLAPLPEPKLPLPRLPKPEPYTPEFPRASQRSPPRRTWDDMA